jgi:hypothetical protein
MFQNCAKFVNSRPRVFSCPSAPGSIESRDEITRANIGLSLMASAGVGSGTLPGRTLSASAPPAAQTGARHLLPADRRLTQIRKAVLATSRDTIEPGVPPKALLSRCASASGTLRQRENDRGPVECHVPGRDRRGSSLTRRRPTVPDHLQAVPRRPRYSNTRELRQSPCHRSQGNSAKRKALPTLN